MRTSTLSVLAVCLLVAAGGASGAEPVGHPGFASPHAQPIALSPTLPELYVANTAADTLEVLDTDTGEVARRIDVGIDPVSVAVRPDGNEVWVSNHVSDTVSVIDTDPGSPTHHQVVATVQAWDESGMVPDFEEPMGIAFASDEKAYVALSSRNFIAVVDVASRRETKQIQIYAQEPRAIAVRGERLFVLPFESGNQTTSPAARRPRSSSGARSTPATSSTTATTTSLPATSWSTSSATRSFPTATSSSSTPRTRRSSTR